MKGGRGGGDGREFIPSKGLEMKGQNWATEHPTEVFLIIVSVVCLIFGIELWTEE